MKSAVARGEPYAELVVPYETALKDLSDSKEETATNLVEQGSDTLAVGKTVDEFVYEVGRLDLQVKLSFENDAVTYHDFFPHGKSEYNHNTIGNIGDHFATIIAACDKHKDVLGAKFIEDFTKLRTKYNTEREDQGKMKGATSGSRSVWDDNLVVAKDLLFHNLLMVCDQNRGHPERISTYFDQSIITPVEHTDKEANKPITTHLIIAPGTKAVAAIELVAGRTVKIESKCEITLPFFGAATINQTAPVKPYELITSTTLTLKTEILGAPTNKFLIIVNGDSSKEGEVDITLI